MFEAVIPSAKTFRSCVDSIASIINEGEFEATDKGLTLRAMDPSQIAMVDFVMPSSAFESYEADGQKFALNMEDLSDVMARARGDEKLTLKLDKDKARLILIFKGSSTRRFVVPLMDIGTSSPKEPSIEFEAVVKANSTFLKDSLKDTQLVSSHVILNVMEDAFLVQSQGDKGEVVIRTEKDSDVFLEYNLKKESRAMFPLEYLNDLLKNADSSTNVEISMRTDAPLKVSYNIGAARITYYLAPRIETD